MKLEMAIEDAHKRAIESVLQWIHNEVNTNETQVVFRTFAPVHFRYMCFLDKLLCLAYSVAQTM